MRNSLTLLYIFFQNILQQNEVEFTRQIKRKQCSQQKNSNESGVNKKKER